MNKTTGLQSVWLLIQLISLASIAYYQCALPMAPHMAWMLATIANTGILIWQLRKTGEKELATLYVMFLIAFCTGVITSHYWSHADTSGRLITAQAGQLIAT
jgi:hypothetical protein